MDYFSYGSGGQQHIPTGDFIDLTEDPDIEEMVEDPHHDLGPDDQDFAASGNSDTQPHWAHEHLQGLGITNYDVLDPAYAQAHIASLGDLAQEEYQQQQQEHGQEQGQGQPQGRDVIAYDDVDQMEYAAAGYVPVNLVTGEDVLDNNRVKEHVSPGTWDDFNSIRYAGKDVDCLELALAQAHGFATPVVPGDRRVREFLRAKYAQEKEPEPQHDIPQRNERHQSNIQQVGPGQYLVHPSVAHARSASEPPAPSFDEMQEYQRVLHGGRNLPQEQSQSTPRPAQDLGNDNMSSSAPMDLSANTLSTPAAQMLQRWKESNPQ